MTAIEIANVVTDFFTRHECRFEMIEESADRIHLRLGVGLLRGAVLVICSIHASRFEFLTILPFAVPEARRGAVADAITRANYGLFLGNFEMDFSDGELRYRTSLDLADGSLTPAMVERLFLCNLQTVDHYLPALQQVALGGAEPAPAILVAEQGAALLEQLMAAAIAQRGATAAEEPSPAAADDALPAEGEDERAALSDLLEDINIPAERTSRPAAPPAPPPPRPGDPALTGPLLGLAGATIPSGTIPVIIVNS